MSSQATDAPAERLPLRVRLALYGLDGVTLLVAAGGAVHHCACSSIPLPMGCAVASSRRRATWLANYTNFFSDPFLYDTIEAHLLARHSGRR